VEPELAKLLSSCESSRSSPFRGRIDMLAQVSPRRRFISVRR
jgi:hypothetical protein